MSCHCRACRDVGEIYGLPIELGSPHGTVATLSLDRDGLEWLVMGLSNQWRDEAVEEMRRALTTIDERIFAHKAEDRPGISIRVVMRDEPGVCSRATTKDTEAWDHQQAHGYGDIDA